MHTTPVIPKRKNAKHKPRFNRGLYRERNRIERLTGRLKQFRRVATRTRKTSRKLFSHADDCGDSHLVEIAHYAISRLCRYALVFVGMNINQFARRSASPSSLYAYIARGLGATVGVLSGWSLVLAYLFTAMAVLGGFANYTNVLVSPLGIQFAPMFLYAICAGIAWYCAYSITVVDIKLRAFTVVMVSSHSLMHSAPA